MKICVYTAEFRDGEEFKWELYPSPEVAGVSSGWASQKYFPDCEVVRRVFAYVLYPDDFEAAPVRPEDLITS